MEIEEELPGVTLYHGGSKLSAPEAGQKYRLKAVLTVEAHVNDETLWKDVEKKFSSGLRIFSADDFKTELVNAYRNDNTRLKAENEQLRHENARIQRENEHVQRKNEEYRSVLGNFSIQLNGEEGS